jgi:tetratricopeptide (TPR) repeat protein
MRLALLSGEPGIGKTRLSTHAALEARLAGAVVLYGRCDEELRVPHGPWVEALSHYVEHAPEEVLRGHVERHGGELARLVPGLRLRLTDVPPASETDPDTERYLLWGAVVGFLREASAAEPLVLVLDDLHWADKPTLRLLKHLLVEGQGVRALIIGTYRDSDLHRGHPMTEVLADLRREQGVERLAIGGLGQSEIVEIMERAGGHELDPPLIALSHELFRETDGNPFYTGEILRHLLESGTIYQQENGRFTVRLELSERGRLSGLTLPQSVREVLGRRVERLGQETANVLSVAAVIGREFDIDLLAMVSERSEDELLELLESAVAASVLVESPSAPGRFSFAHALINHTLYEDLGTTRRARLHRRIAEALEQLLGAEPGARVGELAHHWAQATTAVDLTKAVDYARLAGERALDELAPDEAVRWFNQALELLATQPESESRRELLVLLGGAQRQAGDSSYRDTLLEAARLAADAGDVDRQTRAVLATWRGMSSLGQRDDELVTALEAAAQALPQDDPRRAEVLVELAAELALSTPLEHRRALADDALALARRAGDPRLLCEVLVLHAFAIWVASTIDERVANLREAVELADRAGDPALRFLTASRCCNVIEAGDLDGFDACISRMTELLEAVRQPIMRWTLQFTEVPRALMAGRLEEADALALQAFEASGGSADGLTIFGAQIVAIRWEQGRLHELVELVAQAVIDNPALPAFKVAHAMALCSTGDDEKARELLDSVVADGFASVPLDLSWSATLANWSEVAFRIGAQEAAAPLYELLLPHKQTIVWTGATIWGPATRHLGRLALMLERYDEAETHLAAATAEHDRLGAPVWQADTDRLLGMTLLRRPGGDSDRGHELLRRSADTARGHGAARIGREAEEALAELAHR